MGVSFLLHLPPAATTSAARRVTVTMMSPLLEHSLSVWISVTFLVYLGDCSDIYRPSLASDKSCGMTAETEPPLSRRPPKLACPTLRSDIRVRQ